ncbi:MAG: hypothetical protein LLG00_09935 [Planctomycetaceae bacterium]|nr:hypothetical protein [Planctomycetaceae bacterium]
MKSLIAKLSLQKTIGLYLGEHEVAVSQVAATLLGPVPVVAARADFANDDWLEAAKELLKPFVGRRGRPSVAIGLPVSRVFFATRLIAGDRPAAPEPVLQKAISSPNINVSDLTVDLLWSEAANKANAATIAVCRKRYMNGLMESLGPLNIRLQRAEPAPNALVRLALLQRRFPRSAKMLLCVFLGDGQGLAVMVCDRMPWAWRAFPMTPGNEATAILSAARNLRTQQSYYGLEFSPQFAVIHGRPDLHERLQEEGLPSSIETRVLWQKEPGLDAAAIALGLAIGGLTPEAKAFDLSKSVKPRPSLWEIFPWGDLAFTSVLIAATALSLGAHATKLDESLAVAQARRSKYKYPRTITAQALEKEGKDLDEKVAAVRKFLDTRIGWSSYTADLAERLPAGVVLDSFNARCGLPTGRAAGSKAMTLAATAPMGPDGAAPREIDAFLNSLRHDPVVQRDFASAELTGIKPGASQSKMPRASFGIVGIPKPAGAPAAAPPAKKVKK